MAMSARIVTWVSLLSMAAAVAGCSPSPADSPVGNSVARNSSSTTSAATSSVTSRQTATAARDGTIASEKLITDYQYYTGQDIKLYQVFYWSHGLKIEAYLTEPAQPGHYPLFVNLHGGYAWLAGWSSFGYTAQSAAALANQNMVMLYPEYEGYMQSQGMIHGMKNDTLDVQNAITAAKVLGEVAPNDTYLIGYSLGGGLALMTAAVDHEVKAVVAVSPFVGLNDFVAWAQKNAVQNSTFHSQLLRIEESYGRKVSSEVYNERSPDIHKIQAPVLLLQGTGDKNVAWQTVQTFYQQMKQAHKVVKLVLYPGGQHGLHHNNAAAATQEITTWFSKYGLTINMQN